MWLQASKVKVEGKSTFEYLLAYLRGKLLEKVSYAFWKSHEKSQKFTKKDKKSIKAVKSHWKVKKKSKSLCENQKVSYAYFEVIYPSGVIQQVSYYLKEKGKLYTN